MFPPSVVDPAITIGDTYPERLLLETEYLLLGPEGARRSGGSAELFNLSKTRYSKWGSSFIKSGTGNLDVWTPSELGYPVIHLNAAGADQQFIELPSKLVTSESGTVAMLFKTNQTQSAGGGNKRLLQDGDLLWGDFTIQMDLSAFGSSTFGETRDSTVSPELFDIFAEGLYNQNQWTLLANDWGPPGKHVFSNGVLLDSIAR